MMNNQIQTKLQNKFRVSFIICPQNRNISWAFIHKADERLSTRSCKVSKPRDSRLNFSNHWIWQSHAGEMAVKVQSDMIIKTPNLAFSRLREIWRWDVLLLDEERSLPQHQEGSGGFRRDWNLIDAPAMLVHGMLCQNCRNKSVKPITQSVHGYRDLSNALKRWLNLPKFDLSCMVLQRNLAKLVFIVVMKTAQVRFHHACFCKGIEGNYPGGGEMKTNINFRHKDDEIKWPTFCRRRFLNYIFLHGKYFFRWNTIKVCCWWFNLINNKAELVPMVARHPRFIEAEWRIYASVN